MINVDLKLFRAAAICASKEVTRYYLMGVYVQKHPSGGALLVGTDGHRMLVAHDEGGTCEKPAIVSVEPALMAAAARAKDGRLIVDGDGCVLIQDFYRSPKSGLVDGSFPDWSRIPKEIRAQIKAGTRGLSSFNSIYLSEFAKIAAVLIGKKSATLRVVTAGPANPALVLFPNCAAAYGVLMPVKTS